MALITGDKLPARLQAEALQACIYRTTIENGYQRRNPCGARTAAITDRQWLAEHAFYVTKRGTLDARKRHAEPAYLADDAG